MLFVLQMEKESPQLIFRDHFWRPFAEVGTKLPKRVFIE